MVLFSRPKDSSHVLWGWRAMLRSVQDIFRSTLSEFSGCAPAIDVPVLTYLFVYSLASGEEYFQCYECTSRISSDDCDAHKVAKNCSDRVVYMDGEEWWPTYDRCFKIVDETKDPPWFHRRCGFYDLFLYYIREKCFEYFCTIEQCSQPLCLIGGNNVTDDNNNGFT